MPDPERERLVRTRVSTRVRLAVVPAAVPVAGAAEVDDDDEDVEEDGANVASNEGDEAEVDTITSFVSPRW